jgi:hypothetical protein
MRDGWLREYRKIVLLSRRSARGSDPLGEPFSFSGTLKSNTRDQSPERSNGTTRHSTKLCDSLFLTEDSATEGYRVGDSLPADI